MTARHFTSDLLSAMRLEPDLIAVLGSAPRLYDSETTVPGYPYAVLERAECADASVSEPLRYEHRLQFAVFTRHGGLGEARSILHAIRTSIDAVARSGSSPIIRLMMPLYSDAMRTRNPHVFRGVTRLLIHSDEA